MTVYVIYITFIIFVILLVLVGIYFISLLHYQEVQNKKVKRKVEEIRSLVEKHINNLDDISDKEIEYLRRLVHNRIGLEAFYICFNEHVETQGFNEGLRAYSGKVINHKILMENRIVRYKYRQSYILYLIAGFGVNSKDVEDFALSSLKERLVYIRNNALRVIKSLGSIPLVLHGLEVIDNGDYLFNYRILVDILDNFKGDKKELNYALLNIFDNYGERTKRVIIDHFSNCLVDSEAIKLKVLDCFSKYDSKGIILASTRYFGRIIDSRSKELILKNLNHPDWEVRAMSSKVLVSYNDDVVRDKLMEKLNDENYFVRYNSAFSFIYLGGEIKDHLGNEVLLYAIQRRNIIPYEDHRKMVTNIEEGVITS